MAQDELIAGLIRFLDLSQETKDRALWAVMNDDGSEVSAELTPVLEALKSGIESAMQDSAFGEYQEELRELYDKAEAALQTQQQIQADRAH